jgi:hypothetical protein
MLVAIAYPAEPRPFENNVDIYTGAQRSVLAHLDDSSSVLVAWSITVDK